MTNTTPHLTAGAAALLAEPQAARIRAMRSRRWGLYPRAKQALGRLDALLDHPRGTRMPSIDHVLPSYFSFTPVCFSIWRTMSLAISR